MAYQHHCVSPPFTVSSSRNEVQFTDRNYPNRKLHSESGSRPRPSRGAGSWSGSGNEPELLFYLLVISIAGRISHSIGHQMGKEEDVVDIDAASTRSTFFGSETDFCRIYFGGLLILVVSSIPSVLEPAEGLGNLIVALFLIGLGSGGVKSCLSPFIGKRII